MMNTRQVLSLATAAALSASAWATVQAHQGYRPGEASRLSGTYELDRLKSDSPQRIVTQVTRTLPVGDRDRVSANLMARLDSPQTIAIDLHGRSVTIMSSNAPRLTFDADGRDRTEPGPNGRMITTHADVYGDELTVSTTGNRGSDFTVRFEPVMGGLRVTRRLDTESLQEPVTVQSTYRRVADQPRWTVYAGPAGPPPPPPGAVFVPDGTTLTGRLDRDLSTNTTRNGERFTLTVTSPGPYRGGVVEGVVARSERGNGRADMAFDFDRIRLGDGRSGPLEAQIMSVRLPNGSEVRVDQSGAVRDRNTSNGASAGDTAIGAGLGALIGAIAGGGKGAAIGAVVGGAGTVIVETQDSLTLPAGSLVAFSVIGRR